eukprot:1257714-Prymnesium_polylepis.1
MDKCTSSLSPPARSHRPTSVSPPTEAPYAVSIHPSTHRSRMNRNLEQNARSTWSAVCSLTSNRQRVCVCVCVCRRGLP